MPSVYIIQNTINGDIYIGKANNTSKRWHQHKNNHIKEKFPSSYLYRAFEKYGLDNFSFQVLETFETSSEALESEGWYITYFKSLGAHLYNLTPGGDGGCPFGVIRSNETKMLISQGNKENWKSVRGSERRESIKNKSIKRNLDFDNDFSYFEDE